MRHYELLCVLRGTLAEDQVQPIIDKVKEVITKEGGEIVDLQDMGKSRIAYPIKHIRYGYFHLVHFSSETSNVQVIQKKLGLISELLRAVITLYDPEETKAQGGSKIGSVVEQILTADEKKEARREGRGSGRENKKREKFVPTVKHSDKKEKVNHEVREAPLGQEIKKEETVLPVFEEKEKEKKEGEEKIVEPQLETEVKVEKEKEESPIAEGREGKQREQEKEEKKEEKKEERVISMEDIDKKLDEILQSDLDKV